MLKTGKCVNVGKPCSKALKREIQEADSMNFVCSECGQKLVDAVGQVNKDKKEDETPINPHRSPKKTFMQKYGPMMGLGAGLLAIAGGVIAFLGGNGETLPPPPPPVPLVEKIDVTDQVTLKKGEAEQLTMTVAPQGAEGTFVWRSSNEQVAIVDNQGQVTAVGNGEAQISVSLADNAAVSDVCACKVTGESETSGNGGQNPPLDGHGKVDLGYGIYVGDLKNGKPHGHGVITYKTTRKIVDSKDFVAQPGDEFEGDFRDGRISSLGYWKHNGNQTAVKP